MDRMLDIGREDTLDEKIATLQEKSRAAEKRPAPPRLNTISAAERIRMNRNARRTRRMRPAQAERNYQENARNVGNEQNAALNRG